MTTSADEHLDEAKKHLNNTIKSISRVVIEEV